jgi:hypothetical protein
MSEDLSSFFQLIAEEKKKKDEEFKSVIGELNLDGIFEEVSTLKKENKENKKKIEKQIEVFENFLYSEAVENKLDDQKVSDKIDEIIEDFVEDLQSPDQIEEDEIVEETLIEKSLGLLAEPSNEKIQTDPLTPLTQNFATLDDLQRHYRLFLERIQQQLSTVGGGGETNLAYMDMPLTYVTTSTYTIKPQDYYIGINYAGAVTITLPTPKKNGKTYIIKDELGEASRGVNRHIYIYPSGTDLIDEEDYAILAFDYGSLTFVYRNGWRVV